MKKYPRSEDLSAFNQRYAFFKMKTVKGLLLPPFCDLRLLFGMKKHASACFFNEVRLAARKEMLDTVSQHDFISL